MKLNVRIPKIKVYWIDDIPNEIYGFVRQLRKEKISVKIFEDTVTAFSELGEELDNENKYFEPNYNVGVADLLFERETCDNGIKFARDLVDIYVLRKGIAPRIGSVTAHESNFSEEELRNALFTFRYRKSDMVENEVYEKFIFDIKYNSSKFQVNIELLNLHNEKIISEYENSNYEKESLEFGLVTKIESDMIWAKIWSPNEINGEKTRMVNKEYFYKRNISKVGQYFRILKYCGKKNKEVINIVTPLGEEPIGWAPIYFNYNYSRFRRR
jgi:hypothetical protein